MVPHQGYICLKDNQVLNEPIVFSLSNAVYWILVILNVSIAKLPHKNQSTMGNLFLINDEINKYHIFDK